MLGRSRLQSVERQQAGLNDDLKAVFETLEASEIAYGAHAGLVARRIRALQTEARSGWRATRKPRAAARWRTGRGRSWPSSRSKPQRSAIGA